DDIALVQPAVDATDASRRPGMCQDLRAGRADQTCIASSMVLVLMGVQDLGDLPAALPRRVQAPPPLEGVHRERLSGLPTGDEIVEVAQIIGCTDALDQHGVLRADAGRFNVPGNWRARHNAQRRESGRAKARACTPATAAALRERSATCATPFFMSR